MTGLDRPVAAFLDRHTELHNFIYQTRSYLELWLPMLEDQQPQLPHRSHPVVPAGSTVRCILQNSWQSTSAHAVKRCSHAIVRWKNVNPDREANR